MDENYPASYELIVSVLEIAMSVKKQIDKLVKTVKKAKRTMKPQPKLPISVPFNILKPKKITDKYTQTEFTIPEQFVVEEIEGGTRYSYVLPKTAEENISKQVNNIALPDDVSHRNEDKSQSATTITDKQTENKATDAKKKDSTLYINISTMTDNITCVNNEICKLFNDIIEPDGDRDTEITKDAENTDDRQKTVDKNNMKDILGSSENYKIFANKIYTSIGKLFKSGVFSKNINKLNNISVLFDHIIAYCIEEFKYNKSNNKDLTTNDCNNKDCNTTDQVNNQETCTDIPSKTTKNIESEIELHLQTMKQENKDDDEDISEHPDAVTGAALELAPQNQIQAFQSEIFNQDKQNKQQQHQVVQVQQYHHQQQQQQQEKHKQQQPQQIKSIGYDPYINLFMTQQQNENSNNRIKDTRPPCLPAAAQNLPQTQTYTPNYYTNHEPTNKTYRHPYKRSYSRPNTPYQRPQQINKVPTPQPHHPQPPYTYPQYYQQQNVHMQTHMQGMYTQNPPYH